MGNHSTKDPACNCTCPPVDNAILHPQSSNTRNTNDPLTFALQQNNRYDRFVANTPYGNLLADTGSSGTIIRDAAEYEECIKRGNPQGSRVYGVQSSTNTVDYCINKQATQGGFNGVAYTDYIPPLLLRDPAIEGIMGLAPANPSCKNKNDASLTAMVSDADCVVLDPLGQKLDIVKNGSCKPLKDQYRLVKDVNGSCTNHVVIQTGDQTLVVDSGFPGNTVPMGNGTVLWGIDNLEDKKSMFDFDKQLFSQT